MAAPTSASKGYTSSARLAIPVSAYFIVEPGDWGVTQPAIPSVAGDSKTWYVQVPNTFRIQKPVQFMRPGQELDPVDILVGQFQCVAPIDPGRSTSITSASNTYWYINGYLFLCTTSGTTASAVPAALASGGAGYSKSATVTDGTAVWTCQGRQVLIEAQVYDASSTGSPLNSGSPAAQEYDFFQL